MSSPERGREWVAMYKITRHVRVYIITERRGREGRDTKDHCAIQNKVEINKNELERSERIIVRLNDNYRSIIASFKN